MYKKLGRMTNSDHKGVDNIQQKGTKEAWHE